MGNLTETFKQIQPLENSLEKAMAPHSSTLAWKIPWTEEPGRLQSMGLLESDMTERLHFHFSLSCIGEGNGNPFQCSCLENPRDRGAWWAAVYAVAQSWTWLKRLSSSSSSVDLVCSPLSVHAFWRKTVCWAQSPPQSLTREQVGKRTACQQKEARSAKCAK